MDTHAEASSFPAVKPTLLTIPLELRQAIYDCVFDNQYVPHGDCHLGTGNDLGCRCGDGVSRTNSQLYQETRPLFYQSARFVFTQPEECARFLNAAGDIALNMGALSITCYDGYSQEAFRRIFEKFASPAGRLRILELRFGFLTPISIHYSRPLYLPSIRKAFAATIYDVSWRPAMHPLAELTTLHTLTIEEQPMSVAIEEALLKLSLRIEQQGAVEGKTVRQFEDFDFNAFKCFYCVTIFEGNPSLDLSIHK